MLSGKSSFRCHRGAAGFTLIELLVVLAIVSTLLGIVVPRYVHRLPIALQFEITI